MPTIVTFDPKTKSLISFNPNSDAKTGRWCYAPGVPDLCYTCFDRGLRH